MNVLSGVCDWLHNNKLLESSWVVTKVIVKPSFVLKWVRWQTKFVRLMRLFEIDVAECNLKPSMKRFKTFGILHIAPSACIFLYFIMKIAIYNHCELRMTHERKSAWSVSCLDCLHFAFLAKIRCKQGPFHSVWESKICFILRMVKRN